MTKHPVYVNDLEVNLSADQVCLYADDTSFVIKETSREGKSTKAETVMREAERWFAANKLKMNPNKTQHLDFIMNRREDSTNIKILGLHVDSRLTWAAHIDDLAGRLSAAIYSIRRIKSVSTYQAARLTFTVFGESRASLLTKLRD
ncbi:Reverse transcriptase (RNA-dependent DNA polymerase) [Popillia japonica]|uniref:Reverse transcriptase (RNA-dependent DNA polymerase) n=1 Tax=Popillia japonica TaxID=7064 RepID=A0AAW1M2M8_POPJA